MRAFTNKMDTTIRITEKVKEKLDKLFVKDLSYNTRVDILCEIILKKPKFVEIMEAYKKLGNRVGELYAKSVITEVENIKSKD